VWSSLWGPFPVGDNKVVLGLSWVCSKGCSRAEFARKEGRNDDRVNIFV